MLPDQIKYGAAGGLLLLFYKFTNSIFPPAVIVPVLISQNGGLSAGVVWWSGCRVQGAGCSRV